MNHENDLIYEAYLKESYVKTLAMSMLCALGMGTGCAVTNQNDVDRPQFDDKLQYNLDVIKDLLNILRPFGQLSEEQEAQLQADLETQLQNSGVPHEGWVAWFNDWMGKNVA